MNFITFLLRPDLHIIRVCKKKIHYYVTDFASRGREASKENENGESLLFIKKYKRQAEWGTMKRLRGILSPGR